MPLINFDKNGFLRRYPEFDGVDGTLLGQFFVEAGYHCANDASNPAAQDATYLQLLLWALTAHLAKLYAGACGDGGGRDVVGQISAAQQGTVSVQVAAGGGNPNEAYYLQTQYGAQYLQLIKRFRSFRYHAPYPEPGWMP